MKKYLTAAVTAIIFIVALFLVYQLVLPLLTPKNGFLQVTSSIPTKVSLDGVSVDSTPYRGENLKVGNHKLELEAKFSTASSKIFGGRTVNWSATIALFSNVLSVVNLDFGPSTIFNASEILTLHKGSTSISVATDPSEVDLSLDDKSVGKSPYVSEIKPGVHRLKMSKDGFLSRQIDINVQDGFQTVIQVALALNPLPKTDGKIASKNNVSLYSLPTSQASLTEKPDRWAEGIWFFQEKSGSQTTNFDAVIDNQGKTYYYDQTAFKNKVTAKTVLNVAYLTSTEAKSLTTAAKTAWDSLFPAEVVAQQIQILSTPTGNLKVRETPTTAAKVLATVNPGEKYTLLAEQSGWYKIQVGTVQGWVSSQYAKKL